MTPLGRLRHRLTLESPSHTPDGQGGQEETFAPITTLWAAVEPLSLSSVSQRVQDLSAGQTMTHRILIRYRGDLTTGHRFTKGERIFVIKATRDPDETKRVLVCLCEERKA